LAEKVDLTKDGVYREINFTLQQMRELRYAALLHDFGKIGVKENVLLKAKKLYPYELESIMQRLDTIKYKNEAIIWREIAEQATEVVEELKTLQDKPHVCNHSGCSHAIHTAQDQKTVLAQSLWKVDGFNRKVEQIREAIVKANESQVLQGDLNIKELVEFIDTLSKNLNRTILMPEEKQRLLIPRGTLSPDERREIESHVSHTFTFLYQIAWTDDLGGVPEIAHAHHEKLDGTGYPRGLKADQIPIQARMMTICDIYDALTAMDRAYKKSLSNERALDILNLEVKEGKLDKNLVDLFIEAGVYRIVQNYKKKAA
jgi:response regulator RpfG family c-di-GMP phosphodiesterase